MSSRVAIAIDALTDSSQITETTAGSSTPKEGTNGQAPDAEGDQAMDEDEPGAVDARSIYIGNVCHLFAPIKTSH